MGPQETMPNLPHESDAKETTRREVSFYRKAETQRRVRRLVPAAGNGRAGAP